MIESSVQSVLRVNEAKRGHLARLGDFVKTMPLVAAAIKVTETLRALWPFG